MQGGYEQLTGWHDFHARQYDAALGRWFGVDAYTHSMPWTSPYNAMANNPVMFVDPDGNEPITFAIIAMTVLKGAAAGAAMNAASYGISTAMSGQSWDWGQFAGSVGKGALTGGLTAGASIGFSAGLNTFGVGAKTANYLGGALGSFSGNLMVGGLPSKPMGWAMAGFQAHLRGVGMMSSNPLLLGGGDVDVELPEVIVSGGRMRGAGWWGNTQHFLDGGDGSGFASELMVRAGGKLMYPDELPLSSGAINPVYPVESMMVGGIATRGAVSAIGSAARGMNSFVKFSSRIGRSPGGQKVFNFQARFPKSNLNVRLDRGFRAPFRNTTSPILGKPYNGFNTHVNIQKPGSFNYHFPLNPLKWKYYNIP